jgi:hypothetical protein
MHMAYTPLCDALPNLLSANPAILTRVVAKIPPIEEQELELAQVVVVAQEQTTAPCAAKLEQHREEMLQE